MELFDNIINYVTFAFILVVYGISLFWRKPIYHFIARNSKVFDISLGVFIVGFGFVYYLVIIFTQHLYQLLHFGDISTLIGFTSGWMFLFRWQRGIKMVLPWMFLAGVLAMLLATPGFVEEGVVSGVGCYIRHAAYVAISLMYLTKTSTYTKKDIIAVFAYALAFVFWIIMTAGVPYWVTGNPAWAIFSTTFLEPSRGMYVYDLDSQWAYEMIEVGGNMVINPDALNFANIDWTIPQNASVNGVNTWAYDDLVGKGSLFIHSDYYFTHSLPLPGWMVPTLLYPLSAAFSFLLIWAFPKFVDTNFFVGEKPKSQPVKKAKKSANYK